MSESKKLELKYIIENIKLEIEFQDLTDKEINQKSGRFNNCSKQVRKITKVSLNALDKFGGFCVKRHISNFSHKTKGVSLLAIDPS